MLAEVFVCPCVNLGICMGVHVDITSIIYPWILLSSYLCLLIRRACCTYQSADKSIKLGISSYIYLWLRRVKYI